MIPLMRADLAYGPHPSQRGDLYVPERPKAPVVCLLHGGFWRMPYGRDQMVPLAEDLVAHGFAVWNLEYRRLGEGGGWPTTFEDVALGIDHLAALVEGGEDLDLSRVATMGHSAGGHLALWAAGRHHVQGSPNPKVRVAATVGQAAVADLHRAFELDLSQSVVAELLGGSPSDHPERYASASPRALLPLRIPQLLVHGTSDDVVPIEIARSYAKAAQDAGDAAALLELPAADHFAHLDVLSPAWAAVRGWLTQVLAP
jgi:acetyl esterase/lipase